MIRDGATVCTLDCRDGPVSEDRVIQHMVGRQMADRYPHRTPNVGPVVFQVKDWRVHHAVHRDRLLIKGVNLEARQGEIVGIAGLMGAGRTELAMSVFGRSYGHGISGEVWMHGKKIDTSTIGRAIAHGLAYVTEDRKGYGLVLNEPIDRNITLANLDAVSNAMVIDDGAEFGVANDYRKKLRIRCANVSQPVVNLSGGNQQKVVLAKWLFAQPRSADPGRTDPWHRRRREVRDLHADRRTRGAGQDDRDDLVRDAGAARHVRPHLRDERRPLRRRVRRGRGIAGKDHAGDRAGGTRRMNGTELP